MKITTTQKLLACAALVGCAFAVTTLVAQGNSGSGITFAELAADRAPILEALNTTNQARPKSGSSQGSDPFMSTISDGQTTTTTHLDGNLRYAMLRQLDAVDMTRFFAEKYGLDEEAPMPSELAAEYAKFTSGQVDAEAYIGTLELWIDRKPRWLED